MTRLWESNHPYYAEEGNYFSNGHHTQYESWEDFYKSLGTSDPDMNLVYRWDWCAEGETVPGETFKVFFVGQRKAYLWSTEFPVRRENEPAIRAWLAERAKTITAIWAPLNLGEE